MPKDPKQIVTPFAFDVHRDLLGLPLATPKRRLLALLIDLFIAAILSALGNIWLALAGTVVFFWIAIRTRSETWWQNALRFGGAALASFLMFALLLGLFETTSSDYNQSLENDGGVTLGDPSGIDWAEFSKQMATADYTDSGDVKRIESYADSIRKAVNKPGNGKKPFDPEDLPDGYIERYSSLAIALRSKDSLVIDSLRPEIASIIARPEIEQHANKNDELAEQVDDLEDANENLREKIENPSFLQMLKAATEDFGLKLGWVGVYFILSLALFRGRTVGKKLLSLRVVRLNNKPIGIWYSFERFGGYAAGLATGLLGFLQVYWDPNRQAIHDKIAGTVVIDLREKKKIKTEDLRQEILENEKADS